MGATTTTTITELVTQIESEAKFWMAEASLFYPGSGRARQFMQYADLRNQPGVAYRFNKFAAITADDATEGQDYGTTSALDTTGGQVVTATEKAVIVPITDLAKDSYNFGPDQLIQEAGRAIGMAMATKFDKDVMALFASLGTSEVTTGNPVTYANFMKTIQHLRTHKAPAPYAAFFHPWGWHEFITESSSPVLNASTTGAGNVGDQIWQQYFAANILGVECYYNADIPTANAGADYSGAMLSPWALGAVLKRDLRIEEQRDASARQTELVGVMAYGVGVIDSTMGFNLLMDAD